MCFHVDLRLRMVAHGVFVDDNNATDGAQIFPNPGRVMQQIKIFNHPQTASIKSLVTGLHHILT